jgi:hypothetical protein
MKGRDVERLARKHLLPVLPGYVARGSLVYRRPVDWFLRGLSVDTSAFTSSRIFVSAFVHPLYLGIDYITLTWGFRIGDDFWDVDDPDRTFTAIADAARRDALPFLESVTDLDAFAELIPLWLGEVPRRIAQEHSLEGDDVVLETLGYTEILRGNDVEGRRLLAAVVADRDAHEQIVENARRVLADGRPVLEAWRADAIRTLRLEE